jgi:hypothetical protein
MEPGEPKLSVFGAMLWNVGPNLLGVLQNHVSDPPTVTFYYDGDLTPEDQESVEDMHTSILADLAWGETVAVVVHANVRELPSSPPGIWVFARRR